MRAENSLTVNRLRFAFAWALGGLVVEILGLGLGAALAESVATNANKRPHPDQMIFSRDVWIGEKRGMSLARDPKTGRLLSADERQRQAGTPSAN